ncbi:MAG: afr 3 [Chloroflexi bacterium]|nr:afr 3 [Chloroflexota bacterium]
MGTSEGTRCVGYALVGAGAIAGVQAEALATVPSARLVAVYNHTPEKAQALGERWGVFWATDFDALLARHEVNAVSICTPSGARAELAERAAYAGKHVVCEKPMEVTLERADRIIRACDAAGVQLGVIFPARFQPATHAAYQAVSSGRLGRLTLLSAHVPWYRTDAYYASGAWRGTWELDGGGALMNQSIHWIDLLLWFGGAASTVCGYTDRLIHPAMAVEDTGVAIVHFANGALGTIAGTTAAYPGLPASLAIYGEHGTIIIEERRIAVWKLADASPDEEERMLALGAGEAASGAANPLGIGTEWHRRQFDEITGALLQGRAPAVDGREGRKAVALIRAVYDSAATGREVTVPAGPA